jgi:hypothetical protein
MNKRTYDMNDKKSRRHFLEDYWVYLAGFAYSHYSKKGRGAVLISNSSDANGLMYLSLDGVGNYPEIKKAMQEYNPEQQIVAVIALVGVVSIDVYRGEPSPPSASRALSRRKDKGEKLLGYG